MTFMRARSFFGLLFVLLSLPAIASTQETEPAQAAASVPMNAPADAPSQATAPMQVVKDKKGRPAYTGPSTVVVLPPTPMLDEEGKQRQDPNGKLMFNPSVMQQRDKKGHPLFDEHGKAVMQEKGNLGYDERGKKLHALKEKKVKVVSVAITRGTLTVDGLAGKAALNYEIKDLKYIYIYVPWIGTSVVSNEPFPGASEQKNAFNDKTLTVMVGEHILQLTSETRLLSKKSEPAFVLVDKNFSAPTKFPVMGYGPTHVAPYAWPGSKENQIARGGIIAPPLPVSMRPVQLLQPCPAGQMRKVSGPAQPGHPAVTQPCTPIVLAAGDAPLHAEQIVAPAANEPAAK